MGGPEPVGHDQLGDAWEIGAAGSCGQLPRAAGNRGKRADRCAVIRPGAGGEALEFQGLAEADGDAHGAGQAAAGGLCLERSDHRARHHRHLRLDRHRGHSRTALVEPPVVRPRPLRVDPQHPSLAQHRQPGPQRGLRRLAAGAVHRNLPDPPEERRGQPPAHTGPREVLGLRQERHPPRHDHRHHEVIRERQMIARNDRRPLQGHMFQPLHPRPEDQPQQRPQKHVLEHLVEHRASPHSPEPAQRHCLRRSDEVQRDVV